MKGARIFVAEDDYDVAHLTTLYLGEVRVEAVVIHDGLASLERATAGA